MRYISSGDISFRKRKAGSHKGENGVVKVIGGSEEFVGAPALAGLGALRSGCDLCSIIAPHRVAWAINTLSPDLISVKVWCRRFGLKNAKKVVRLADGADAVVIGCGIGLKSASFVRAVVKRISVPLVIDADAIKALSLTDVRGAVFTPHAKELEILLENSGLGSLNRIRDMKKKVGELQKHVGNNVLLIKGKVDYVVSGGKVMMNRTGNAGMTKGGTGDVLAGVVAGLIAQGHERFDAACYAAYINGLAGDILLKRKKGYTFLASDIAEDVGRVMKKLVT